MYRRNNLSTVRIWVEKKITAQSLAFHSHNSRQDFGLDEPYYSFPPLRSPQQREYLPYLSKEYNASPDPQHRSQNSPIKYTRSKMQEHRNGHHQNGCQNYHHHSQGILATIITKKKRNFARATKVYRVPLRVLFFSIPISFSMKVT